MTTKGMTKKERLAYIEDHKHLFGTDTDTAIAKRLGITQSAAYRARVRFGKPRYKVPEEELKRRKRKRNNSSYIPAQERQNMRFDDLLRQTFRPVSL